MLFFDELDQNLVSPRGRNQEEIYTRAVGSRTGRRINGRDAEPAPQNFRDPRNVPHQELDLLNPFSKPGKEFRNRPRAFRVARG